LSSLLRRIASWNSAIERASVPISSCRPLCGIAPCASPRAIRSVVAANSASGPVIPRTPTMASAMAPQIKAAIIVDIHTGPCASTAMSNPTAAIAISAKMA
jgi:hypothetical protein